MSYDIVIKGGLVVDGTGEKGYQADVAIADGKIAEIGRITDGAKQVVDASGLVVSPGFIDLHTHYDAQICWDQAITPSSWHGVTSVVMGNCGVGIAPCRPKDQDEVMRDLVNVEGIPYDVLNAGITWDWETFPEYMEAAGRRGPLINLGFIAPLTPFRHYVMGEDSTERAANAEETQKIKALLKEAVRGGAFGFSTSNMNQHIGHGGKPLACKNASREELSAYCSGLKELGKGFVEIALTKKVSVVSEEEYGLLDFLLTESGRPVTFIAMLHRDDIPEAVQDSLRRIDPLTRRGAVPQVSPLPFTREISMFAPQAFASMKSWGPVFNQSKERQAAIYADPAFRQAFREEAKGPALAFSGQWERVFVTEAFSPELKRYEGRSIESIAEERGKDGVDAFLDLTLQDDLKIEFHWKMFNVTEKRLPELLNDKRTVLGLSDAGAHVDALCDAGYATYLLGRWVRELEALTLENAVRRLTGEPAGLLGLKERGRLKTGLAADVAIFDPATVGSPTHCEKRFDLPGGGKRLVVPSRGIEHTIVNGQFAYRAGKMTEAKSGQVLRS